MYTHRRIGLSAAIHSFISPQNVIAKTE